VYTKSIEHSCSGLQVPVNHECTVCVASEDHLGRKVTTYNSMFNDISFVTSVVSYFSSENIL
jgi:hypothetical protein